MKRREVGQGLVEYALVLNLVAVVVVVAMTLLGPQIACVFGRISAALGADDLSGGFPTHEVTVSISGSKTIFVETFLRDTESPAFVHCAAEKPFLSWKVEDEPSQGDLTNNGDGTFFYEHTASSGQDDSFTYEVGFASSITSAPEYRIEGEVSIIVGDRGSTSSAASITQIEPRMNEDDDDDQDETFEPWREAGLLQEERFQEGTDLTVEAFVEFLETLREHLDEIGNKAAANVLSVLRQALLDGNFEAVPALLESLPTDLGDALADLPEEVQMAAAEKLLPRLEESSEVLSEGIVDLTMADEIIQQMDEQLDGHPNETEILQLLNEARDLMEARNEAIEVILAVQEPVINQLQEFCSTVACEY